MPTTSTSRRPSASATRRRFAHRTTALSSSSGPRRVQRAPSPASAATSSVRYHVASCNDCTGAADNIPTLKRIENINSGYQETALAEGVQNLQFEYAFDTSTNGVAGTVADGMPEEMSTTNTLAGPASELGRRRRDAMTHVLMRSSEAGPDRGHHADPVRPGPRPRKRGLHGPFQVPPADHHVPAQQRRRAPGDLDANRHIPRPGRLRADRRDHLPAPAARRSRSAALRSSTTSVQIVGDTQARQEAQATAQMLIEEPSAPTSSPGIPPAWPPSRSSRRTTTATAPSTPPRGSPTNLPARPPGSARRSRPNEPGRRDLLRQRDGRQSGRAAGRRAPAGSLCADTDWQINATATDPRSGVTVMLSQGVTVRREIVGLICNRGHHAEQHPTSLLQPLRPRRGRLRPGACRRDARRASR